MLSTFTDQHEYKNYKILSTFKKENPGIWPEIFPATILLTYSIQHILGSDLLHTGAVHGIPAGLAFNRLTKHPDPAAYRGPAPRMHGSYRRVNTNGGAPQGCGNMQWPCTGSDNGIC